MSRLPEYQREGIMEVIKQMQDGINWHLDQVEKLKQEIKKHQTFLTSNEEKDI